MVIKPSAISEIWRRLIFSAQYRRSFSVRKVGTLPEYRMSWMLIIEILLLFLYARV